MDYEEWRDIPGYVGLYQASDLGRIRSVRRLVQSQIDLGIRIPKTVLKPGHNKQGRLQVMLCKMIPGVAKCVVTRHQVHKLVYTAFSGEVPDGINVLHDDGNHLNNVPGNLYLGTQKQNMQDKVRHGTQTKGEGHPPTKLTEVDVIRIRIGGEKQSDLAKELGVTQAAISHIRSRKTWKHVSDLTGGYHEQDQAASN